MGRKHMWFARWTGAVWTEKDSRTVVMLDTRLTEGAPASHAERPVTLRLTPERAQDLSRALASRARSAIRRDVETGAIPPVRLTDSDRISEVDRIRRNYAEMTGAQYDPVIDGLSDLLADLIKVAERHDLDPEEVINKAREHAAETADFKIRYFAD